MIFLSILLFSLPPRGAPPNLWQKYKDSIDLSKNIFKCFDGSATINLSQFNNNFPDCKDGSDEPGSSYESGSKFYCKNEGWIPQNIDKWQVDDGVCDCCDCSDESSEIASKFGNQCSSLAERKKKLISHFQPIFKQGFEIYKNYSIEGENRYKRDIYDKARLDHKISKLEQLHQRVIDQKPTGDLDDPDDFVSFENFTPPAKLLSDSNNDPESNEDDNPKIENEFNDDDEYRYERYYGYYDRYRYYQRGQSYRNDFTYEYIPQHEDNNDNNDNNFANNYEGNQADYMNYDQRAFENTDPLNDITSEELSPWREFFKKIWRYTFLFPDRENLFETDEYTPPSLPEDYDHYSEYGYSSYDEETQTKLNAIQEKLNQARGQLYGYEKLGDFPTNIDKAYYYLFGKEYHRNDYTLTMFQDFKQNWDYYGNFHSLNETTQTMDYANDGYCQGLGEKPQKKQTRVHLICWNEDKIARVIKQGECRFEVYFASPVACRDAIERLPEMSYQELDLIAEVMKVDI